MLSMHAGRLGGVINALGIHSALLHNTVVSGLELGTGWAAVGCQEHVT